jgi:hypothetical protein
MVKIVSNYDFCTMTILETLAQDYKNFPEAQTYSIYAADVYFKDPLTQFRGLKRYQEMISFIKTWFQDIVMEVHSLQQAEQVIESRWTLHWTTPLPWHPRISISGRSELTLNAANQICSHIDYWDCSRWEVIKQHFPRSSGS